MTRKRRKRKLLSILVVLFTLAAVAAACLAIFCFHYYTVTSNSMSPTLMGSRDLRDRVLCWLRAFPGREPRRWEVVIFHTPDKENLELLKEGKPLDSFHDMTIKRIIGLGGETLALRDGDVWTRRGESGAFARQVKPPAVQNTLWIPVYEASFPATGPDEFAHYWRSRYGEASRTAEALLLPPGAEFRFRPLMRTGGMGREMKELRGVPDRYLLPQNLILRCGNCGTQFTRWFAGGQVQERCPACDTTAYEESVIVYNHDSGLTSVGDDMVTGIPAGDANRYRVYPYHTVGDLRVSAEALLPSAQSSLELRLEKNGTTDSVRISPAQAEIKPGEWFKADFARVDGELRLTVNDKPVQTPAPKTPSPAGAEGERTSSGVSFATSAGGARLRRLSISRDIHYFSGVDNPFMPQFDAMTKDGEVEIPEKMFFTLGDNTDVSLDSRAWGPLPYPLLTGTAAWWSPAERFGQAAQERGRH